MTSDPPPVRKQQETRIPPPSRINPILIVIIVLGSVLAWQWYDTRGQISELRHELAKRLAEADASGKESRNVAAEAGEAGRRVETKLGLLEARVAESQSQQLALEELYQQLTRGRDEATLEEVEQLLLIANQQLHLANNVKAALLAMQEAESQLQVLDRPQLAPLRKALAKDMDLLKSVPYLDIVGISLRLDTLAASVDDMPLTTELRPPEAEPSPHRTPPVESIWLRFVQEVWEDVKQLVRIQYMNRPDVAVLSPSQAYFLRENLKLRLLSARYSLLAHNGTSFRADLDAASDWLNRYYDTNSEVVVNAREALIQLGNSEVEVELPRISASLDAVRNYRLTRDRGNR